MFCPFTGRIIPQCTTYVARAIVGGAAAARLASDSRERGVALRSTRDSVALGRPIEGCIVANSWVVGLSEIIETA